MCQHCGHHPFAGQPGLAAAPVDEIDDDERWLWQLVAQGDQIRAEAPPAPTTEEIGAARRALAAANATCRRVESQVAMIERALADPLSWFRPARRNAMAKTLRRARAATIAATSTREAAERAFDEMERRGTQRRTYLATHRAVLAAAAEARHDLDRRVDDLIDAYAKLPEPPAWFRFGLGYPPRADDYASWLARARAAISYRRRNGIDHPLEPTGGEPY